MARTDSEQLVVELEARVAQFERNFKRANQTANRNFSEIERRARQSSARLERTMGQSTANLTRSFATLGRTMLGVFGVGVGGAALTRAIQGTISSTAALGDLADRLDVSAEALQRWRFAARQSGADAADVDKGLEQLTRRLGLFRQTGAGPAADAFRRLGLDTRIASGELKTSEQVFRAAVEAMEGVKSAADRAAIAGNLFGDRLGPRLATLLGVGGRGLDELGGKANVLGNEMVAQAQRVEERWKEMTDNVRTGFQIMVLEGIDALQKFEERSYRRPAMLDMGLQDLLSVTEEILTLERQIAELRERDAPGAHLRHFEQQLERLRARQAELNIFDPAGDIEDRPAPRDLQLSVSAEWPDEPETGTGSATSKVDHLGDALRNLKAQLDPVGAATRQLSEDQQTLADALATGRINGEAYADLLDRLEHATRDQIDPVEAYVRGLKAANEVLQLTLQGRDDVIEFRKAEAELVGKLGRDLLPEEIRQLQQSLALRRELTEAVEEMKSATDELDDSFDGFGRVMTSAFEDAVISGAKLSDVLQGLAQDVARLLLRQSLNAALGGMSGGGGGGLFGGLLSALFAAKGAAFSGGNVVPMARGGAGSGGILKRPTAFPMRSGGMAIGGELADEAILPLRRLPSGDLGVASVGGGSSNPIFAPSININIDEPHVQGEEGSARLAQQMAQQVNVAMQKAMSEFVQKQRRVGGLLDFHSEM